MSEPTVTRALDEQAAVIELIRVVNRYVYDHTRFGRKLPVGTRLEIHPRVRYMVLRSFVGKYVSYMSDPTALSFPPELPVKINPELPDSIWRIVVVTELELLGGQMPSDGKG